VTAARVAGAGTQAERTALAWRRTALTVAVGSLVALRLLPGRLGAAGFVVATVGLLWSVDLALASRRRYAAARRAVSAPPGTPAPAAGPFVVRALAGTVTVGAASLVAVLLLAGRA
jgi:uncharacterized membrane protein YidH (DUF202 family)